MGIFSHLRRSASKSNLMKSAGKKLKAGDWPLEDIWNFYESDHQFSEIIERFKVTKDEISKIMVTMTMNGAGGTYRGHCVPVSAMLFPDILVYLIRAYRDEVNLAEACWQVRCYFQTGAIIFDPVKGHG